MWEPPLILFNPQGREPPLLNPKTGKKWENRLTFFTAFIDTYTDEKYNQHALSLESLDSLVILVTLGDTRIYLVILVVLVALVTLGETYFH